MDDKFVPDLGRDRGSVIEAALARYAKREWPARAPPRACEPGARRNSPALNRVEARQGDALHLPYPESHFDYVVSDYTLHHLMPEELMMIELATLPAVPSAEGEYYTTVERWTEVLGHARFSDFKVAAAPPGDFGLHILCATGKTDGVTDGT